MKTRTLLLLLLMGMLTAAAQPKVTITTLSGQDGTDGNKVTGMLVDERGLLWLSTWGGLYRYDGYEMKVFRAFPGDGNELANARLDDVQEAKKGQLLCQSYDQVFAFDMATCRFRRVKEHVNMSDGRAFYHDTPEFRRAGYRLKIENDQLKYYDKERGGFLKLVDGLRFVTVDDRGVVWAGLDGDRFVRIVVNRPGYQIVDKEDHILTLFADRRGFIWQGNNDGTVVVRDSTGHPLGFLQKDGSIGRGRAFIGRVYCMTEDDGGRLLLGTRGEGLICLQPTDGGYALTQYIKDERSANSLPDNSVYSLLCDRKGRIWIGTYEGGLCVMTTDKDGAHFMHNENGCPNFPPRGRSHCVRSMTMAGDVIVLGTGAGLFTLDGRLSPDKATLYKSVRIPDDETSPAANEIVNVAWHQGSGLLVCGNYSGVSICDEASLLRNKLPFRTWNTLRHAPSDHVLSTIGNGRGSVWAVFKNTLSLFNASEMRSDDLPLFDDEDNALTGAACISAGRIWLGSLHGLVSVGLNDRREPSRAVPIIITALRSHDREVPYDFTGDTLRLGKNQRDFSLTFAALALDGNERVEYAYRIEGEDTTWNTIGRHRTINIFDLKAGSHTLLLRSTDNNREWLDNVRRIIIDVEPTFWETPLAWLIYALLAIAAAGAALGVILYVYRLRMNMDFEKRMTDVKLKYFTDISHDLRTPLTLIDGPVTEMLRQENLDEKNRGYLTLVHNNARRMLTLVNQILDFRKIQSRRMHLFVERIDLREEVSQVMNNFRFMAEEQKITFELIDRTDRGAYVWGDRDKLQKVFFNLLSNAFKYTPAGRRIWIELSDGDENTLTASVNDEGKGFGEQAARRIFRRFETILADNYMQNSTGIGLSLVKELVQLHHGTLTAKSEEGKGSTFVVTLQKGNEHFAGDENAEVITGNRRPQTADETTTGTATDAPTADADGQMSILVVEDDAEMLRFVADILTRHYRVMTAADGADGLEKARREAPDLILSDINMPRMNGWELTEALRKDVETSHIPVVLLTANSTVDDRIKGARLGADDYIVKPFNTELLLARLQAIIEKRAALQRRFVEELARHTDGTNAPTAAQASETTHPTADEGDSSAADTAADHRNDGNNPFGLELPKDNSAVKLRLEQDDIRLMERLRDFMEDNLERNVPIQELAEHVCMSRTLFYHKVKSITGMTPIDFYRRYHVERAAQLLRGEGQTVAEACYNTGFADPKYFSRVFKQFMGVTPAEYRNSSDPTDSK